jgi:gluconate 5-dehydrogenase
MSIQKLFDLSGRVAVITGGSLGLGLQMAEGLAEAGANIVLAARRLDRCEEAADKISKELGVKAIPVACDVSSQESVQNLISTTIGEFGKIDIMVNNAGVGWGEPAVEHSLKGWNRVMGINLNGCWFGCQEAGRVMIKQGYGKIINLSSVTGFVGAEAEANDSIAYSATKGAVNILTKDLASKWARYGINVNAIAPGYFPTEITQYTIGTSRGDILMRHIPMKRWGGDEDLKGAAVYLASDASSYVNGHILVVDGGYLSL